MISSLKVSHYLTVSQNTYQTVEGQEVHLVLGGRTGALLKVPETIGKSLIHKRIPDCDEYFTKFLFQNQILVPEEEDELKALMSRNRLASQDISLLSFTILPTSNCNMGCSYCGQSHSNNNLSFEKEKAIIERISAAIKRSTTRGIQIRWFGGEPLIGYSSIIRISCEVIKVANDRNVSISANIVTNGTLLTLQKCIELHTEAKINLVEITIDGSSSMHDIHRPLKNKRDSFKTITKLIRDAINHPNLKGLYFKLRTNVDVHNVEYINDYLNEMKSLGFNHERIIFDIHPVHQWSNDISSVELNRHRFAAYEVRWMITMLQLGLKFVAVPTVARPVVCGAVAKGTEMISSTGAIFSCSEHPLVPQHEANDALGHIFDPHNQERRRGNFENFNEIIEARQLPCHSCSLLGICGGACPKHWTEGLVPCPSFKDNLQARLDIAASSNRMQVL